ncbi:Oxidoreductase, aldo/keto reductase family [Rubellimicrobium mesophilum DSM 19309]|uniref:Oxidoreductase, aldo/keto reductase family n=1 Tax=Rubellimicrobium mesophilum DSM 19309 TaxID=442562 RepID=A0A017HJR7_9RHOB|nr:aldo/keto reductase [Rubellimicrobium mesophilum]EYD74540.1 Oxidoreductase, aldo/keto reductase family [Rubellimicrobium mesophilum DSM 19309]
MRQVELGRSGIRVPDMALGTMTFGSQTPEAEAHRQMDMALEAGVTLWDCAETYPTTPSARETIGLSETILGSWFASRRGRNRVVLATKVGGPDNPFLGERSYRGGTVKAACERSLRRLKTDVIDLYQLHWPERAHYAWRRNWEFDPSGQDPRAALALMDDVLGQMAELVAEGKVRAAGLSNETAWGTARWLDRAAAGNGPRMATVQNEYSLLCRLFDTDLAEVAAMEGMTLLAYSPLASGVLTGKYALGTVPAGSRASIVPGIHGRLAPRAVEAVAAYHEVAREARMDPVHMALAWHRTRPFASVPIFGATTAAQLSRILEGLEATVPPDLAKRIDEVNRAHPLPF